MIYRTDGYMIDALNRGQQNNAVILWDNKLATAVFTGTGEREGFEATNAQAIDTASWWWPLGGNTLTMTFAAPTEINAVGIAAHTLGSDGVPMRLEALIDDVWTVLYPQFTPADDEAIMIMFRSVTVPAIRIRLISAAARIGVVYAGLEMVMPQRVYASAPPLNLVLSTSFETNKSQTGQFVGRSIIANARPFDTTWTHLTETWVRSDFLPFILAARRDPFFVALRPDRYPDDVGYVWTARDIVPQRMGIKNFLQVQVAGEAHAGPEV